MLRNSRTSHRNVGLSVTRPTARRPGDRGPLAEAKSNQHSAMPQVQAGGHPLAWAAENKRLFEYESRVKAKFDDIVPSLKAIEALQSQAGFESRAQGIVREKLGYELPRELLEGAQGGTLDMTRLYAWCVFESYKRYCDDFFTSDPLASNNELEFQQQLQEFGFHIMDISPCADGRLAHVIRYVLRLPYRSVRRKSYAGALFDIEDSMEKWTETELLRYREGKPNTADQPTRYLKVVVYHFSSVDPQHEGCAAHGSNTDVAAAAGRERLYSFKQAVENGHCCGASIDLLLVGLDTDTDGIRVHVPDESGAIDTDSYIDALALYNETVDMDARTAEFKIRSRVTTHAGRSSQGMQDLVNMLLINNMSQIEYVHAYHGSHYSDIGHAERFIGAGIGFEEVQLRNLTYFAYMDTVEEAAPDLDVGIKIFKGLNVSNELPIPVVVRYDYHGNVPGAHERAIAHSQRVAEAFKARYAELYEKGLLHILQLVRDCSNRGLVEVVNSTVSKQEAH